MHQIYQKFLLRQDSAMWDLELTDLGGDRIRVQMETNEGYLRSRPVMKVVLDRELTLTESDNIENLPEIK